MEKDQKQRLDEQFKKQTEIDSVGSPVTDTETIKRLDQVWNKQQEDADKEGFFSWVGDIFTGTKRTEYASMPEIGEYKGEGAGKAALGLLITPNQKSQAEIVMNAIPGSKIRTDKYDNPIVVMPDGKSFYLNKPGTSYQDVIQTTAQILQYLPGYSTVAKKYANNFFKRALMQGAASAGTSVVQDVAAKGLGAEQYVDIPKTIVAGVVPTVAEGIAVPLGAGVNAIMKKIARRKELVTRNADGTLTLTQKGREAAEAAGIKLDDIGEAQLEKYFARLADGMDKEVVALQAEGGKFGIDLATSQTGRAQDKQALAALYEATKGTYGPDAAKKATAFLENQNIQIQSSFKNLLDKFNKGEIDINGLEGAGSQIIDTVRKGFQKADDYVQTMYNSVDKTATYNGAGSNIQLLTNSARKGVIQAIGEIDKEITPLTVQALKKIDEFAKEIVKAERGKISPLTLNTFENKRKVLNSIIDSAKGADKKGAIAVKKEFDKFYNDAIDNVLFSGDEVALKAIRGARDAVVQREKMFGLNPIKKGGITIKDKAGEVLQKIINDPDVTPQMTLNYILGSQKLGFGTQSLQIVRRLKKVIGVDKIDDNAYNNADFSALRTAVLERVFQHGIRNGKFSPTKVVSEMDSIFRNNKEIMKELFTTEEVNTLKEWMKVVRNTLQPTDLANLSNTASVLQKTIQGAGRAAFGAAVLKSWGINAMLAARNAFDRTMDMIGQGRARKLVLSQIEPEALGSAFQGLGKVTGTKAYAPIMGATQEAMGQRMVPVGAPQIQPAEMVPGGPQASIPTLDRNMFASLFPGDTLGTAIAERRNA